MAERPHACIQVLGPGDRQKRGMHHYCRIDKEIELDHNLLQRSFPEHLTDIDLDLLTLVSAVAYADRVVNRRPSAGWGRDLELQVPVYRLECWNRPAITRTLLRCLTLLTGDHWQIEFIQLRRRRELQPGLKANPEPFAGISCVVPYSGGLDSFAGLQLWLAKHPKEAALRIGTETNRGVGEVIRKTSERLEPTHRVPVRINMHPGSHAEPTYRTRTFLFFSTAALAAKLAGIPQVLVMENGQGALGPSLVPLGGESPYRSTHPLFTRALYELLNLVWDGTAPKFQHPHLWHTKAQLLRAAASQRGVESWPDTHSCSRNLYRHKKPKDSSKMLPRSCGLCGGCLLRRSAMVAAGFAGYERREAFTWSRLEAESLEMSGDVEVSPHDRDIAVTNILNMKFLAQLSSQLSDSAILRVASEVARAQDLDPRATRTRLRRFIRQHAQDWDLYLDHLGPNSWVSQLGRVLP